MNEGGGDTNSALAFYSVLLSILGNVLTDIDYTLAVIIKVIPIITCFIYFLINYDKIVTNWGKLVARFKKQKHENDSNEL